ncbi:MAG: beta-lactamase family protein [Gemmatimonadaceae bacterium]|nr:beta-lactamase family protein [Gemmatimonadaceae bacterium]
MIRPLRIRPLDLIARVAPIGVLFMIAPLHTGAQTAMGAASAKSRSSSSSVASVPNTALATALANDMLRIARLPGMGLAALDHGKVVYATGVGYRDVAGKRPVDSSTVFGSASVAKVVTATAALRLVQRGVFDLDEPISRRFPDFPGPATQITPRLLAAHLSGIPHYGPGSMPSDRRHIWASHALGEFSAARRIGEPGERSVYSTHGITLMTAMMEQAVQRPILDILRTEVFEPSEMRSSGGLFVDSIPAALATLYERSGDSWRALAGPRNLSFAWGGAGLRHTPADLVRMTRPYFDGTFTATTLATAFTEQRTRDGGATGLGIVWRVENDWRGRALAHHAGVNPGTRTVVLMRRDEARAVAVMVNLEWTASMDRTANVLAEALFDSAPRRVPAAVRGAWAGRLDSTTVQGQWEFTGDTGWVSVPTVLRERFARSGGVTHDRFPVRAIRDDLYALITPWGLYPMELTRQGAGVLSARVQVASQWWTLAPAQQTP